MCRSCQSNASSSSSPCRHAHVIIADDGVQCTKHCPRASLLRPVCVTFPHRHAILHRRFISTGNYYRPCFTGRHRFQRVGHDIGVQTGRGRIALALTHFPYRLVAVYLGTHCNIGSKRACCPLVCDVEPSHFISTLIHLWHSEVPLQTFAGLHSTY